MRLISDEIERELDSQEKSPFNIPLARRVLEQALTSQLKILSNGILAWLLLHGTAIEKAKWRLIYLSHRNPDQSGVTTPRQIPDEELTSFSKNFVKDIVARRVKAINIDLLNQIELRIYGKYVKLYEEAQINNQLAKLGSEYRLAFLGGHQVSVNSIIDLLELDIDSFPIDARFIFGRVGHITALPYVPLCDFKSEVALSPLLDFKGAGFTYDDKIVIRHSILRYLQSTTTKEGDTGEHDSLLLPWVHVLIHESIHIFGSSGMSWATHSSRRRYPYTTTFWLDDTKRDICRFTQIPRSIEDLRASFLWNFDNMVVKDPKNLPDTFLGISLKDHMNRYTLEAVIDEMKKEGLIVEGADHLIYSPIYEVGKRWQL